MPELDEEQLAKTRAVNAHMAALPKPATVGELIEQLKHFHVDTPLFVDGYEGGCTVPFPPRQIEVAVDANDEHWQGRHAVVDPDAFRDGDLADHKREGRQIVVGVLISRSRRD